jgi:ATPase subunit of ABC transporter with duplicated ATPase domains
VTTPLSITQHSDSITQHSGSVTQPNYSIPQNHPRRSSTAGKSTLTFRFPEPEKLTNIASTRAVLKMAGVQFAYSEGKAPVLSDVDAKLMLVSRCAVLGENGAGKSTLVSLLALQSA